MQSKLNSIWYILQSAYISIFVWDFSTTYASSVSRVKFRTEIQLAVSVRQKIRFNSFNNCDLITKSTKFVPLNKYAIKKKRFTECETSYRDTPVPIQTDRQLIIANQKPSRREWRKHWQICKYPKNRQTATHSSSSMDWKWFLFNIHTHTLVNTFVLRSIAFKF